MSEFTRQRAIIAPYLFPNNNWVALAEVADFARLCLTPGDSRLHALVTGSIPTDCPVLLKQRVRHATELIEQARDLDVARAEFKLAPAPAGDRTADEVASSEMANLREIEASAWKYFSNQESVGAVVADIVTRFGSDAGAVRAMVGGLARWALSHQHSVALDHLKSLTEALASHEPTTRLGATVGLVVDWKTRAPSTATMANILALPCTDPNFETSQDGDVHNAVWWNLRCQLMFAYLAFNAETALTPELTAIDELVRETKFVHAGAKAGIVRTLLTDIETAIGIDDAFLIAVSARLIRSWAPKLDVDESFTTRNRYNRVKASHARLIPGVMFDRYMGTEGLSVEQFYCRDRWVKLMLNPDSGIVLAGSSIRESYVVSVVEDHYPLITPAAMVRAKHSI